MCIRARGITEENQEELNGFQLYLDELEGIISCSEAENAELAKEAANGSSEAKKRLIEGNLKNALAMIREYLNKGLPAGDLVQEANMALVMAVEELGTAESVLDLSLIHICGVKGSKTSDWLFLVFRPDRCWQDGAV